MIHVKCDLLPLGHEEGKKQISELFIANVGCDAKGFTSYRVWLNDPRLPANPKNPDAVCKHKRSDGCLILVMKAIKALK
jgi:hypothetical protein